MEINRSGSQPSNKGPADWFTGKVRIDPLFHAPDPARVAGASVLGLSTAIFYPRIRGVLTPPRGTLWNLERRRCCCFSSVFITPGMRRVPPLYEEILKEVTIDE